MDEKKFRALKDILLEDEHKFSEKLAQKVADIDGTLSQPEKLKQKMAPILNDQVKYLEANFPSLFGNAITESIKKQIRESKDEVVDALYPIIGKMIKKYISKELELLSERIDNQLQRTFSWEGWVLRIKAWFGGVSEQEMIMKELVRPKIEEVFIIQQESGLLIGSYSWQQLLDQDMIAGMLTAIKSFVHDAFSGGVEELQTIEYENYKVLIHNLKSFYVALVITGYVDVELKDEIDDMLPDFEKEVLDGYYENKEEFSESQLEELIHKHFSNLNHEG